MAGKIIINRAFSGLAHLNIYLNKVKIGHVDANSTATFDIQTSGELTASIMGVSVAGKIAISDGMVYEISCHLQKLNYELVVTRATPMADYHVEEPIFSLKGARGRHMSVFEDRVIIKTKVSAGSLLSGNASDGEKTIYYSDCIGVQFKDVGAQLGYIQLETASSAMNNKASNFFNENSFTFDKSREGNITMRQVADYIQEKIKESKHSKTVGTTVVQQTSSADELKKFKELLDMGIITQEEFDAKKKQLLGL